MNFGFCQKHRHLMIVGLCQKHRHLMISNLCQKHIHLACLEGFLRGFFKDRVVHTAPAGSPMCRQPVPPPCGGSSPTRIVNTNCFSILSCQKNALALLVVKSRSAKCVFESVCSITIILARMQLHAQSFMI
jgi:hypothetical protein